VKNAHFMWLVAMALMPWASAQDSVYRVEVGTEGHPSRGPGAAPVTIVEFGDFQCPYCGGLFSTLKMVEEVYGDRVRLVFRQLPLTTIHPYAQKAAEASLCAHAQGRFWDYHDSLFGNQEELELEDLRQRAVRLELDLDDFNACLDSGAQAGRVAEDVQAAVDAGVYSTPTMFINGRILEGAHPYPSIAELIDDELRRIAGGN
jgi:protein-disulfide isomerase